MTFNPNQERDDHGRWTSGGGSSDAAAVKSGARWTTGRSKPEKHTGGPRANPDDVYDDPKDALHSLVEGEKVDIQQADVHEFLVLAKDFDGDPDHPPDLTDVHVDGMLIFGGDGLGIERRNMPQIPAEHRERLFEELEAKGITITNESVSPLSLRPTQKEISATRVGEKMEKYEKDPDREFPSVIVSQDNYIMDGHHHWGMMAALSVDAPSVKMPITRLHVGHAKALSELRAYTKAHKIPNQAIGQDFGVRQ